MSSSRKTIFPHGFVRTRIALAAVFLLLAGCGEIPQPFRHEGADPSLAPAAARGIEVRPLDDSPRSLQLAEAIVRHLTEAEIPASTRRVVSGAWVLGGTMAPAAGGASLRWTLSRGDGESLGGLEQTIPAATWTRATPRILDRIAAEVVDKLNGPLHGGTSTEAAAPAAETTIRLLPLAGLPGDGNTALATAMRTVLRRDGFAVVDGEADFRLRGQATVTPGRPNEEILAVAWTVVTKGGEDLGTSAQQGAVPKGRLAGPWGSLATDIAAGGAEGIGEIVRAAVAADATRGLTIPPSP